MHCGAMNDSLNRRDLFVRRKGSIYFVLNSDGNSGAIIIQIVTLCRSSRSVKIVICNFVISSFTYERQTFSEMDSIDLDKIPFIVAGTHCT